MPELKLGPTYDFANPPNLLSRDRKSATARAQLSRRERRPRRGREPQLRVRAFPQQEVAQALLAAGADRADRRQALSAATPLPLRSRRSNSTADQPVPEHAAIAARRKRIPRGVVDGQPQVEPPAARCHPLGDLDLLGEPARQPIAPADHRESDTGMLKQPVDLRRPGTGRTAPSGRRLPAPAASSCPPRTHTA